MGPSGQYSHEQENQYYQYNQSHTIAPFFTFQKLSVFLRFVTAAKIRHELALLHGVKPYGGPRTAAVRIGSIVARTSSRNGVASMVASAGARFVNGGVHMPAFGATLKPGEIDDLVAFLESRTQP